MGGSALYFHIPKMQNKFKKQRRKLLEGIPGSEELRKRFEKIRKWKEDAKKDESSDVSMNTLFESLMSKVHRPLHLGVPRQAIYANSLCSWPCCIKCRFMYEFFEE
jgi:hypothetical protein